MRLIAVLRALWLGSCTTPPTCLETPNNMKCMSVPELKNELAHPAPAIQQGTAR